MRFYKTTDEWFIVEELEQSEMVIAYYKCDQIHGLIDYLKYFYQKIQNWNEEDSV